MDKYQVVLRDGGIEYLLFKPKIFKLYASCYSKEDRPPYFSRIIHRIRMTRELLFAKYEVVYLRTDGKIVGHLVVSRGGTRIAVSKPDDIVIGPIWIIPSKRNGGIATEAICQILHNMGYLYQYAYEYISDVNSASIRTVEKNGFRLVCRCKEYGLMKTLRENENGELLLYRYSQDTGEINQ